ncbi:MAG: hypothetical protein KF847_13105 [Pirellulales bacterium]|nr:hypothetical protein [Pirellulales bacterium]
MLTLRELAKLDLLPRHAVRDRRALLALLAGLAAIFAVGAVLSIRRLFGPAEEPLPLALLLTTAITAVVIVDGGRRVWRHLWPRAATPRLAWQDQALGWTGSAALLLLAVGCCYPGDRTSEWIVWLPLLIADQFRRQIFFDRGASGVAEPAAQGGVASHGEADPSGSTPDLGEATLADEPRDDLLQQLFRVRDEQGVESVYGTVSAEFVPGQRHAVLHVGFCPPLERVPEVEAEASEGPDARIKVLQAYAHGVRLEVRLQEPARQPSRVTVDLAATPTPAPVAAG